MNSIKLKKFNSIKAPEGLVKFRFKKLFQSKMACTCKLYIGAPGAGKSTLAAKFAKQAFKKGIPVFSNVPILGAYILDPKADLGYCDISNGLVIIDEIGVCFNNRNFKTNISNEAMSYIKMFRHYKVQICCFSQGLDFDNRFLGISQELYLVKKSLLNIIGLPISKTQRIQKRIGVDENTHQLIDEYRMVPFSTKRFWRPAYYKYFDTFDCPVLPQKDWKKYESTSTES